MASLIPCPSCGRHVRLHDTSCPFCAAIQPADRIPVDALRPRAKRAITFVAASMAVAACSTTPTQVTPDTSATAPDTTATTAPTSTAGDAPTVTATTTAPPPTATASASAAAIPTTSASAIASATPTAKPTTTATAKPVPTETSRPPGPATRYGLPPYLAEDELV